MFTRHKPLLLHEELMLLMLRDERGTLERRTEHHSLALAGALLAELLRSGRIALSHDRKPLVELRERDETGDEVLDECIALMAASRRRRAIDAWLSRFAQLRRLRHRVALSLCERGVLRDSQEQLLLIFRRKVYPTIDPRPEQELRKRLRDAVMDNRLPADAGAVVLIALLKAVGMLPNLFSRDELKRRKGRIEQLAAGNCLGDAAAGVIQAAEAAAAAAAMVAVLAATSG